MLIMLKASEFESEKQQVGITRDRIRRYGSRGKEEETSHRSQMGKEPSFGVANSSFIDSSPGFGDMRVDTAMDSFLRRSAKPLFGRNSFQKIQFNESAMFPSTLKIDKDSEILNVFTPIGNHWMQREIQRDEVSATIQEFDTDLGFLQKRKPETEKTAFKPTNRKLVSQTAGPNKAKQSSKGISEFTDEVFCTCKNSQCSKMYCECLKAGQPCNQRCKCHGCKNHEHSEFLKKRKAKMDRKEKEKAAIGVFCTCRRSNCLKNYCPCRMKGKSCGLDCLCEECMNHKRKVRPFGDNSSNSPITVDDPLACKSDISSLGRHLQENKAGLLNISALRANVKVISLKM